MRLPIITSVPVLLLAAGVPAQKADRPPELTEETFSAALASILPDPAEIQWRQISWWPDLSAALREARAEDKPILLWAMNGHPCGMT